MARACLILSAAVFVFVAAQCFAAEGTGTAPTPGMTQPEAVVVETAQVTATVEAVDMDKRTVTIKMDDGEVRTFKVGKEARNLDQVKPGDKVTATVVDELAMTVVKGGGAPAAGATGTVAVAPKGAMPGAVILNTYTVSAKVESVDAKKGKVKLEMPDGKKRTMKLGPNVQGLDQLQKGDDIVVTYREGLAIDVTKQ